jgi:hypothetical protein
VLGLVCFVEGSKLFEDEGVRVAECCCLLPVAEGAKCLVAELGLQSICAQAEFKQGNVLNGKIGVNRAISIF